MDMSIKKNFSGGDDPDLEEKKDESSIDDVAELSKIVNSQL